MMSGTIAFNSNGDDLGMLTWAMANFDALAGSRGVSMKSFEIHSRNGLPEHMLDHAIGLSDNVKTDFGYGGRFGQIDLRRDMRPQLRFGCSRAEEERRE
jgi:hypothetical protein